MKKTVAALIVVFALLAFAGCKPKYAAAESMIEVYSMAIKEMEGAKTQPEIYLANQKVKLEILKAINWYLKHDKDNPRIIDLGAMLSITEDQKE